MRCSFESSQSKDRRKLLKYKQTTIQSTTNPNKLIIINLYFLFMSSPTHRTSPARRKKENDLNERTFKFSPVKQFNQKLYTKDYFCHYSNAIYMGGMDCFKKLGHGIMLMDNGACAITCHSHDNMINHNVIFREGSLTSLLISIDRSKTVCFRTGPYLLYFKMSAKETVEGIGYFIHYSHRKVFRLKFQNEDIAVKQRIIDIEILKSIFDQNDLTCLIEKNHANAVKMEFELPAEIKCSRVGETYVIGMIDPSKSQSYIHGVCFKMHVRNQFNHFDVVMEERGYLKKNVVQVFGERHFENGNYYIGEFKNDEFHGLGVLIYPKQKKWTYGEYEKGQLRKVIASSVNNQSMSCNSAIRQIHEYSKPYIQFTIKLNPPEKWLYQTLKAIDDKDPYEHESIDYTNQENKLSQNLNIVQEDYVARRYEIRTEEALKNLADRRKSQQKKNTNKNSNSIQKLRKISKQKKLFKNQSGQSPETKKGKYLNSNITFAPKVQTKDEDDFAFKQHRQRSKQREKQRSRSRSRSKEQQKLQAEHSIQKDKNKVKAQKIQTEESRRQTPAPLQRFQTNITADDEGTIIRALTGDSSHLTRYQLLKKGGLNPSTPARSQQKPLYNNFTPEVYTRYHPDRLTSAPINPYNRYDRYDSTRYDSPSRRNDYYASTLDDPIRADLRYRISPERNLPSRYPHVRYLVEEDDDMYMYPRMSNRAYIRDNYRF